MPLTIRQSDGNDRGLRFFRFIVTASTSRALQRSPYSVPKTSLYSPTRKYPAKLKFKCCCHAIGIDSTATLKRAAPDRRPRILFHGDSITHGHGVTSPRETYPWQISETLACVPLNYGFGGSAWADNIVAQTI